MPNTLKKAERLDRKKVIGKMFTGGAGAHSFTVFPLRVVYLTEPELKSQASVLISVSKRYFKHAVDRNRFKRLIRESYRLQQHELNELFDSNGLVMDVAFTAVHNQLPQFDFLKQRMAKILKLLIDSQQSTDNK
jgi:ribonuclease P protein component